MVEIAAVSGSCDKRDYTSGKGSCAEFIGMDSLAGGIAFRVYGRGKCVCDFPDLIYERGRSSKNRYDKENKGD